MGEILDEILRAFSCFICCAERPTKISPQIPPNLSLHVLSRLLWLKSQNFISASFWGLGRPILTSYKNSKVLIIAIMSFFARSSWKKSSFPEDLRVGKPLGPAFGRTDFSRFLFLSRRIFSRIFSPDFSPHFCGKKCPEKSSRKIPGKILQNLYNKNPRHISAEGAGQPFRGSQRRKTLLELSGRA